MSAPRRWLPAMAALSAVGLCGAAPRTPGTDVDVELGGGAYDLRRGGCSGPEYRYTLREAVVQGGVSHTWAGGGTVSGAVGLAPTSVISAVATTASEDTGDGAESGITPAPFGQGELLMAGNGTLRAGWHGQYLGAELGGSAWRRPLDVDTDGESAWRLGPSGAVWAGVPKYVYVGAEALVRAGGNHDRVPLFAVIGHQGRVGGELAFGPAAARVEGTIAVTEGRRLGVSFEQGLSSGDDDLGWRAMVLINHQL